MTTHRANGTATPTIGEGRQHPAGAYQQVAGSVRLLMDAQGENDHQRLLVFNPSAEVDSIAEIIVWAARTNASPAEVRDEVMPHLSALLASNERERGHVRDATGPLDLFARTLSVVQSERQGLGVKRAADRLRPALKIIRRAQTEVVDAKTYFLACGTVKDVIGEVPVATLRGGSMRNQLRPGLHGVLCDLLTDGVAHEAEELVA